MSPPTDSASSGPDVARQEREDAAERAEADADERGHPEPPFPVLERQQVEQIVRRVGQVVAQVDRRADDDQQRQRPAGQEASERRAEDGVRWAGRRLSRAPRIPR